VPGGGPQNKRGEREGRMRAIASPAFFRAGRASDSARSRVTAGSVEPQRLGRRHKGRPPSFGTAAVSVSSSADAECCHHASCMVVDKRVEDTMTAILIVTISYAQNTLNAILIGFYLNVYYPMSTVLASRCIVDGRVIAHPPPASSSRPVSSKKPGRVALR
jgi:hypothetical protein